MSNASRSSVRDSICAVVIVALPSNVTLSYEARASSGPLSFTRGWT